MASLNVSMSPELRKFINRRTAKGGFSTPTEYIRHLIREDEKREAEHRLEAKLLEALGSGDFEEVGPEMFKRLRRRVRAAQSKGRRTKARRT
jgi:antitoxin ParD1/3/4